MLTKLTIKNFKRFEQAEIDLGKSVVFIGPNNSGKQQLFRHLPFGNLVCVAGLKSAKENQLRFSVKA